MPVPVYSGVDMALDFEQLLAQQDDHALLRQYRAAKQSILAWGRCVEHHGSLLQSMIKGLPMREGERYPDPDVTDRFHGFQYFYHAHRHDTEEHGHIHLFCHAGASGRRRYIHRENNPWKRSAPSHLLAIGMDAKGMPISLFHVNRWVTAGYWFDASTTAAIIRRIKFDVAEPYTDTSLWVQGFTAMYMPLIVDLLKQRDELLMTREEWLNGEDIVLEDRALDLLNVFHIDWMHDIQTLERVIDKRHLLVD